MGQSDIEAVYNHLGRLESRSDVARAIAKVFAYLACGNQREAQLWAGRLISWLETI